MDMGSWVHSILSPIYGDYRVIDKKVHTIVMLLMVNFYDSYMS